MMIVALKLLSSAATLVFALGYAARRRSPWHHRRLMAAGVLLALLPPLVLLSGYLAFDASLRTGYWLVDLLGGRGAAWWATGTHQVLYLLALVVLTAQAVLGALRLPAHRLVAWGAIPLWLIVWVCGMFFYY